MDKFIPLSIPGFERNARKYVDDAGKDESSLLYA